MGFNLGKALGGLGKLAGNKGLMSKLGGFGKILGGASSWLGPAGMILGGLDAIKGMGKAGRGSERIGNQMEQGAGLMGQFGQQGLSAFMPQYMNFMTPADQPWLGENPLLDAAKRNGLFDATTKQFGMGAGMANRYLGGGAGSSGFNSQLANAGLRKGAADAAGMRQLLIEGNREGYQRYLNFDRERQRRLEGLGNFSTGLMNQGIGHLGGLRGMYASDQQGYGKFMGQLGKGLPGLDKLLGQGRGQGGGSAGPGSTTSQRPTGGSSYNPGQGPGYRQVFQNNFGLRPGFGLKQFGGRL